MATLALKPAFPIPTRSSRPKREHRKQHARAMQAGPWRTMSVTAGAVALTLFCVAAPIIDDPAERLLALESTSTIPTLEANLYDVWAHVFEFTPTTLGPAINAEMLAMVEGDGSIDDDWSIVTMPELEVRALPPTEVPSDTPPG